MGEEGGGGGGARDGYGEGVVCEIERADFVV